MMSNYRTSFFKGYIVISRVIPFIVISGVGKVVNRLNANIYSTNYLQYNKSSSMQPIVVLTNLDSLVLRLI